MLSEFNSFYKTEQLFQPTETILLTVSGGVDSIVMCELFHRTEIKFAIAHCNFQLRENESEADEAFVEALAEKYGVPFHSTSFDTNAFAKKNKLSIQIAARELRYKWFEEIRKQYNYTSIATAHHKDDSVETFFINLIRGTGISGLHGILPKTGKIIHPLLFANKNEIVTFAKKNKLKFREDSSNASDKYVRNKIRLQLIPLLKEVNPDIENAIGKDIQHLRETEKVFKNEIDAQRKLIVKTTKQEIRLSVKKLKALQPLSIYLFEFLKPYHFNSATVNEIANALNSISGKQFLSATHKLVKDREMLIIHPFQKEEKIQIQITAGKKSVIVNGQKLNFKSQKRTAAFQIPKQKNIAVVDHDKLKFPLEIRKWEKGDSFQPLGMKGNKKLSDFFIDEKFSVPEKENTLLLISKGKIAWVIGHRIDDRFKVTSKTTAIYFASLV